MSSWFAPAFQLTKALRVPRGADGLLDHEHDPPPRPRIARGMAIELAIEWNIRKRRALLM
jgi:hypothetical protein